MKEEDFNYPSGKHYDVMIKHYNRKLEDIPFYLKKAQEYKCGSVLELGCGTGRITIPLKEAGFMAVGIDLMELMLKEARRKAQHKNLDVPFLQADVRNFHLLSQFEPFDLILGPAALFQALLSNQDFEHMLNCVKIHLNPDGIFIFHMFNPDLSIITKDPEQAIFRREYPDPDGRGTIQVFERTSYERSSQILTTTIDYKIEDRVIYHRILPLKMYFPSELDSLLNYNGYKILHKYGDFPNSPFTSQSGSQIVVCKKNS